MAKRRAKILARRKASNVVAVIYDSDGEVIPSSPDLAFGLDLVPEAPRKKRPKHAEIEDKSLTCVEGKDFLSQMPFDIVLEVCPLSRSAGDDPLMQTCSPLDFWSPAFC